MSTRVIAWLALCIASSALAVVWWPVGLLPCCLIVYIGARLLLDRRRPGPRL